MDTNTTILIDMPHSRSGQRAGWSIDVHAGADENADTLVNVSIISPRGQRMNLRREYVSPSDITRAVERGWTLALKEINRQMAGRLSRDL